MKYKIADYFHNEMIKENGKVAEMSNGGVKNVVFFRCCGTADIVLWHCFMESLRTGGYLGDRIGSIVSKNG